MTTYVGDAAGLIEVRDELANPDLTAHVLHEVFCEREAQERKWGQQNHPNGTGPHGTLALEIRERYIGFNDELCDFLRDRTDGAATMGEVTFEQILTEEWAEAIAESDPAKLRKELVQVATVAVSWVEKLDRDAVVVGGGV